MVGVEPTSESKSTELSPSASDDWIFAQMTAHRQAITWVIPLVPRGYGRYREVFLHSRRHDPSLQVNQAWRAGCVIRQQMRNLFHCLRLCLTASFLRGSSNHGSLIRLLYPRRNHFIPEAFENIIPPLSILYSISHSKLIHILLINLHTLYLHTLNKYFHIL